LILTLALCLVSCKNKVPSQPKHESSKVESENLILYNQLQQNRDFIIGLRDSLEMFVKSQNDMETPYKLLVTNGNARKIKASAINLVNQQRKEAGVVVDLNLIINSCEDQKVSWEQKCFYEMPYFGVKPILNAWISCYNVALKKLQS